MQDSTYYAALDIGTSVVCALVGRLHHNGVLEVIGSGLAPSRGVQKGVIVPHGRGGGRVGHRHRGGEPH